jgi:Holliday junction resolvase RusA-like endonuclease
MTLVSKCKSFGTMYECPTGNPTGCTRYKECCKKTLQPEKEKGDKPQFIAPDMPITAHRGYTEDGNAKVVIRIPCLPPSKNRYTRLFWAVQQRLWFKPWERYMAKYLGGRSDLAVKGRVQVEVKLHFPNRINRDALNYTAFPPLMDCLTRLGIIKDDNHRVCKIVVPEPVIDGKEITVITISALEG